MMRAFLMLILVVALSAPLKAATATVPGGVCLMEIAAAVDSSTPTLSGVSVPFYGSVTASGVLNGVDSANQVSISGTLLSAGQHVTKPTYFRVKSGVNAGRLFPVVANTASQLTLSTGTYSLVAATPVASSQLRLNNGDSFDLFLANTLGSVFGTSSVPLLSGSSASVADNVLIFNGTEWVVYFHDGTGWKCPTLSGDQNQTVIPPGTAVFVKRRALTAVNLPVFGTVPAAAEIVDLAPSASRFFGNRFPFDTTLGALGIQAATTWRAGASASAADCLRLWNGSTWEIFYFNGTHWRKAGSLLNCDTQKIPACSGLFIVRRGTSLGADSFAIPAPYTF